MSTNGDFAIVGLTGGIAAGKTTVARMFEGLGTPVIDADDLARAVVEPGRPALEEIREVFGDEVLDDDGRLDRDALGALVFDDESARDQLEAITHPHIARRMQTRAAELREQGHRWVVYDAALIVENGLHEGLAALVVVLADRDTRLTRLQRRDGLDREEAESRLDAQMPQSEKRSVADYLIDNSGSLDETERQVRDVHATIDRGLRRVGSADPEELREAGLVGE
ncbi:MAG: dephospho-CoA kinase [Bradymonadaceae bacterium]